MVNKLLTNSIRVNVPFSDMSRRLTTGDDHEVQEGSPDPWPLVVAVRFRLGFCRRKRISKTPAFLAGFLPNNQAICDSAQIVIWRMRNLLISHSVGARDSAPSAGQVR